MISHGTSVYSRQNKGCKVAYRAKGHALGPSKDFQFFRAVRGNFLDKLMVPPYLMDDRLPKYMHGPGILITRNAVGCMAHMFHKIPIFFIDDINLGFLMKACKVSVRNVPKWDGGWATGLVPIDDFDYASVANNESVVYHFNWGRMPKGFENMTSIIHNELRNQNLLNHNRSIES